MNTKIPPGARRIAASIIVLSILASVSSCLIGTGLDDDLPGETFEAADRPAFEHDPDRDFMLMKPWNYDKPWNANRRYPFIKNRDFNAAARESTAEDEVAGFPRTTKTLTKGGIEIMKLSRYENMGHDGGSAFADPAVLDWLFGLDIGKR